MFNNDSQIWTILTNRMWIQLVQAFVLSIWRLITWYLFELWTLSNSFSDRRTVSAFVVWYLSMLGENLRSISAVIAAFLLQRESQYSVVIRINHQMEFRHKGVLVIPLTTVCQAISRVVRNVDRARPRWKQLVTHGVHGEGLLRRYPL